MRFDSQQLNSRGTSLLDKNELVFRQLLEVDNNFFIELKMEEALQNSYL